MIGASKIVRPLEKVRDSVLNLIEKLIYPIIGAVFVLVFMQVLFRYVFHFSLFWIYELVLFLMAFVTFLGSAVAIHNNGHPRVEMLLMMFPEKLRLVLYVLINLLIIWFTGIFAVEGYKTAVFSIPQLTPALSISLFWPYLSLPLGGGLMCLITVIDTIILLITKKMPEPEEHLVQE